MLAKAGISRSQVYVTNIMKTRPANNDFGVFYEDPRRTQPKPELLVAIEELKQEILRIKPNVVVPLGSEPLRAITGRRGIDSWRGSILQSPVGKVVGTYHPAYILRVYGDKPIVELDLRRVREESRSPSIVLPKPNFLLDPSYDATMDYLRAIRAGDRLAFDIETFGPIIRCLGLSKALHSAICIPFMSNPCRFRPGTGQIILQDGNESQLTNHYREEEEYQILKELNRVFQDQEILKVAQNAPFDIGHLAKQFGIICHGLYMDTMVAWHTLYPELPKGLDFLCSVLTRIPYYSDHDRRDDYQEWTYNCWDAAGTWEISFPLEKEAQSSGLFEFYDNHVKPTLFAATRTENRGILINETKRSEMKVVTEAQVNELRDKLRLVTGNPSFNPNSPKQLCDWFYGTLKLPIQYSSKRKADGSRSITADKNARDQLAKRFPVHADKLRLVDDFSKKETLLSGFLNRPTRADGRMYTHFNIVGTVGSRWSSSDPIIEVGTNLQNIPIRDNPEFRDIFIADPNWTWVKADLKSAEYMVVVWGANIQRIIQRFIDDPDYDPHIGAVSMAQATSMSYDEMLTIKQAGKSHPSYKEIKKFRDDFKNGNYGGNYGMSPPKAAIVWKVEEYRARQILETYHRIMPEISQVFWPMISKQILTNRTIISPLGRRRQFFGRIEEGLQAQIMRDAYSHYAQNIVGDIINRAAHLIDDIFPDDECKIILQVHDELDLLCRTNLLSKYLPKIKKLMEYPIRFPGVPQPLIIPAEISYGPTWYQQKEWDPRKEVVAA